MNCFKVKFSQYIGTLNQTWIFCRGNKLFNEEEHLFSVAKNTGILNLV